MIRFDELERYTLTRLPDNLDMEVWYLHSRDFGDAAVKVTLERKDGSKVRLELFVSAEAAQRFQALVEYMGLRDTQVRHGTLRRYIDEYGFCGVEGDGAGLEEE